MNHQVLLYYKYIELEDPTKIRDKQRTLCEKIGLKGRIIVSVEGINGTVEGTIEATEKYIVEMKKIKIFEDIVYKKSESRGDSFPKLSVKVRPEIVTTGIPNLNPLEQTGKRLTADELHKWFELGREFYIVDMRNSYEYISGYFENSIFSGMYNFYELSKIPEKLAHLKNKTVVTVCTGGVRCEKASGFLLTSGFIDVYQLQDGIQTYMEKYPNEHFKGKLYVFDKRLTIGFNTDDSSHEIVGKCMHCGGTSERYVNCEYDECHYHYICCENCVDKETGFAFDKPRCKTEYLKQQRTRKNKNEQVVL